MNSKKKHTALILASSSGLGFAAAKALCEDGHNVIIGSRSERLYNAEKELKMIHSEAGILAIPTDVTQIKDLNHLVNESQEKFKTIDILFTNGPGPKPGNINELDLKDFSKAHDDILFPVIYLAKRLIPGMISNGWGRIIINTSITAKEPSENMVLSNIYRAALVSFAKTLSAQLAVKNITVNAVGPASFKTERAEELLQEMSRNQRRHIDEIEREITEKLPMKRYNDPEEFGKVVAFLAGEASSALTGSYIAVDGGMSHGIF